MICSHVSFFPSTFQSLLYRLSQTNNFLAVTTGHCRFSCSATAPPDGVVSDMMVYCYVPLNETEAGPGRVF